MGEAVPTSWFKADFYRDLGVTPDASDDQIRAAFKQIARKTHPDLGGEGREALSAATQAYKVLGQAEERQRYDAFRDEQQKWARRQAEEERRRAEEADRIRREAASAAVSAFQYQQPKVRREPLETVTFIMDASQLAFRGPDHSVVVNGTCEYWLLGFLVRSPDGAWISFDPQTHPGRYTCPGRGGLSLLPGGPRGDLFVDVSYPPRRGLDQVQPVSIPGESWWTGCTVPSLVDRSPVYIPARTAGGTRLCFRGRGFRGEFDGPDGDLYVDLEYYSEVPSKAPSTGTHPVRRFVRQAVKAVGLFIAGAALILILLLAGGLVASRWISR